MRYLQLMMKVMAILLALSVFAHANEYENYSLVPGETVSATPSHNNVRSVSFENMHEGGLDSHCAVQFLPPPGQSFCRPTTDRELFSRPNRMRVVETFQTFDPPPPRT